MSESGAVPAFNNRRVLFVKAKPSFSSAESDIRCPMLPSGGQRSKKNSSRRLEEPKILTQTKAVERSCGYYNSLNQNSSKNDLLPETLEKPALCNIWFIKNVFEWFKTTDPFTL